MPEALLKEARDMVKELGLSTLYANCGEFWTADEVLINSLQGRFPWVKWIGR
jgi:hypothetical protein